MQCDVCDREMIRWEGRPAGAGEKWSCPWCYAITGFDEPPFKVCRPGYMPPDLRWEAASTEAMPDAVRHAYGYQRRTLCGIAEPDMHGSPFGMWPWATDDPCPDCTALAEIIDARWPIKRRHTRYRMSIRVDGAEVF